MPTEIQYTKKALKGRDALTALISHARISVPADCFELVSELVRRLGGRIDADDDGVVTVPPMSEKIIFSRPTSKADILGRFPFEKALPTA